MTHPSELEPGADLPLGPVVDASPARRPEAISLAGRFGSVERLDISLHGDSLWEAIRGHDQIWTYMSYGPFADRTTFLGWIAERQKLEDPFYYAVVDRSRRAIGLETLLAIRPDMRVVEVGHVLLSPALQRTPLATEAQYLLARYVFETLGYRRYEWKCNVLNAASHRAALRFGFVFEGIFRSHMISKGRSRDTAWFAMLDTEWPARKAAFECWLAPENFDAEGRQRTRLRELNAAG